MGIYPGNLPTEPEPRSEEPALSTVEARYKDLLNRLGVNGHDGAVSEITNLRKLAGLDEPEASSPSKTSNSGVFGHLLQSLRTKFFMTPEPGQVWQRRVCNPWRGRVVVIDVKEGWVRYSWKFNEITPPPSILRIGEFKTLFTFVKDKEGGDVDPDPKL